MTLHRFAWRGPAGAGFSTIAILLVPVLLGSRAPRAGSQASEETTPSDSAIANVVDRELLFDSAVSSNQVDVDTSDGVVTLTGSVATLLAKERAARIAETVKGVRTVVNRIRVEPSESTSDDELRLDVEQALLVDPAASAYEVTVDSVAGGHVSLSGTVDSWKKRELTGRVVKGVDGVTEVTNDVAVEYDTERPDAELKTEIEQALRWNALVDHGLIDVAVANGKVHLSGIVGSAAERREAIRTAWTFGVSSIDPAGLEVERWARDRDLRENKYVDESEEEILAALEAGLRRHPRVAAFEVHSSLRGNVVTLRGVVDNLRAKRSAEQVAEHTVGIGEVHNYLKVRPTERRSEGAVGKDVREALARDPYVEKYEITVQVDDGTVRLYGLVDSYFEKAQADDIASRVAGVTYVANNLVVDDDPYAYDPYVDGWHIYDYDWYDYEPSFSYRSDEAIAEATEDELFWSPFVDADDVSVEVVDGVATLTGTVDSWMEKGAARDNAYEAGATYVRNELVVSSEESGSAAQEETPSSSR